MKSTTTVKVLWSILMLVGIVYEALAFVRLRREHVQIFDSTREMVLVAVLVAVMLAGVVVKSRKNAGRKDNPYDETTRTASDEHR